VRLRAVVECVGNWHGVRSGLAHRLSDAPPAAHDCNINAIGAFVGAKVRQHHFWWLITLMTTPFGSDT
jgi:hypothetical protein